MQTHPYLNKLHAPVAQASSPASTAKQAGTPALRGAPLSEHLSRLEAEVARLEADGHYPIGAGIRAGRPCIELAPSPRLAALAGRGEAAYYMRGRDADGVWRRGTLMGRRVTAFWTERGVN